MMIQIVFIGHVLLQSAVLCAVFIALFDLAKQVFRLDSLLAFFATVFCLGVLGYLCFWIALANYAVFSAVKAIVLALLLWRFAVIVYRRKLATHWRWLAEPLAFTFLFF